MRVATCRSCDAPIVWALTENGKKMPVDADRNDSDGNVTLAEENGELLARVFPTPEARTEGQAGYTSHFATCPNANEFRRPRAGVGSGVKGGST